MDEPTVFNQETAMKIWLDALLCEFGLVIQIPNPNDGIYIQAEMYKLRNEIGEPRLMELQTHLSEDKKILTIKRKEGVSLP